jgi:hypothetical protein
LQDPTKFTQNWIFGLKTNHLATLSTNTNANMGRDESTLETSRNHFK